MTTGLAVANVLAMTKAYRPYTLGQQLPLPRDMGQWLLEGDLALFISNVVDELDLAAIHRSYETGDGAGPAALSNQPADAPEQRERGRVPRSPSPTKQQQ